MRDIDIIQNFSKLTPEQRKSFESDILSMLSRDAEISGEVTDLKHEAYKIYAINIAHLIAELEVYSHDLPKWMYGFLEMIFRLSATAAGQDEEDAKIAYKGIIRYEQSLINIINLALIDYYAKEIRQYKQTLSKFKHRAIYTKDGIAIIPAIRICLKKMSKLKRLGYKKFKKRYTFNRRKGSLKFKLDEIEEPIISELKDCVDEGKEGMDLCENFYPVVINNGFVSSCPARIVHWLPTVISFALAIVGAMILILK